MNFRRAVRESGSCRSTSCGCSALSRSSMFRIGTRTLTLPAVRRASYSSGTATRGTDGPVSARRPRLSPASAPRSRQLPEAQQVSTLFRRVMRGLSFMERGSCWQTNYFKGQSMSYQTVLIEYVCLPSVPEDNPLFKIATFWTLHIAVNYGNSKVFKCVVHGWQDISGRFCLEILRMQARHSSLTFPKFYSCKAES